MKNFLKKLHMGSNQSEDSEGSIPSSMGSKLSGGSPNEKLSHFRSEQNKPFSAISGWLNSVTNRHSPSPPSSSNVERSERMELFDSDLDAVKLDSESSNSRDPDGEEEYQIQLALELSAREDPEAVQIEAVKQISLGSCTLEDTPAEVVAYRYWNYSALSYDDKILDGFYDLYGISMSTSSKMPSLVDLQGIPVSENVSWEAILVNKEADIKLSNLGQKAIEMAVELSPDSVNFVSNMVKKLATLVSDYMGGPVSDPDDMLISWRNLSYKLKENLETIVLPLGSLTIGLARHRALLFKVLADSVDIPCCLVKGLKFTGSDDVAMTLVKVNNEREYIIDLMADPGTFIPSDAAGLHIDYEELSLSNGPLSKDVEPSCMASSSSRITSPFEGQSEVGTLERRPRIKETIAARNETIVRHKFSSGIAVKQIKAQEGPNQFSDGSKKPWNVKKEPAWEIPSRSNHRSAHARSPSWTEGVSSPAVRRMKVKDVSQYMIDAAKENPQLAQKLHDVLLESGVIAPPNLFTEVYPDQLDMSLGETKSPGAEKENTGSDEIQKIKGHTNLDPIRFLPSVPHQDACSRSPNKQLESHLDLKQATGHHVSPEPEIAPVKYNKNVPVAAAAAAVVASSMVVAVAKTNTDPKLQLPVAAAATAAAAAVAATTAAVSKQYELETSAQSPDSPASFVYPSECLRNDGEADIAVPEHQGTGEPEHDALELNSEGERISDRSTGNDSAKSDIALDDVADCEIAWDEITLGSYGEVYHGDWHGTEVAVKKFLDQDITNESLEEFRSEVRIMKKLRHPNIVLFMGAVTRPPNLSIVTEFLPRGSLYRLIHRPNNQLDKRRRLRMALDAARGMNYLHNCTPVIVHRDLKSPNLLVDKNWVVKVGDFGLSKMKDSTFISSKSNAGTAEWMAPEVLRNEPSNEKCDVYSFGVILWELCTLQQPWGGMNPMQVVGAVGFQHRRLDIPDDMDPVIADIIRKCWQTDPRLRPSFAEIMAALKPLQKHIANSHLPRPSVLVSRRNEKNQSSLTLENQSGHKS
ncbi:probable serine/threonine-protein kinase SIS8 isoform X2 [Olea europaea var. sylvestris]|uniref:probable serine/threonine-protein kinase SIS8 isoform X2 n=1 Tax=Olea europaea var. sylvestris TaxID=158386 RepID=UPI000C1D59B3|nr:probable serine/threonine-protein kinase SIS8 isoform X2 [Olea europaea var. sylvestris]